jgi:hypothetical protein
MLQCCNFSYPTHYCPACILTVLAPILLFLPPLPPQVFSDCFSHVQTCKNIFYISNSPFKLISIDVILGSFIPFYPKTITYSVFLTIVPVTLLHAVPYLLIKMMFCLLHWIHTIKWHSVCE